MHASFPSFDRAAIRGWEHLLAGSIVADQQSWHSSGQTSLLNDDAAGFARYQIHVIRGDGTNSSAAQRSKVHSCMVTSTYFSGVNDDMLGKHAGDDVDGDAIPLACLDFPDRTRTCYADLQYLPSSSSAKGMLDVYNNQLQGMGISPLRAKVDGANSGVRVVAMVTDNGPDEKGCEKLVKTELRDDQAALFFRIPCFLHQIHLIVSKQLKRIPRYLLV